MIKIEGFMNLAILMKIRNVTKFKTELTVTYFS